MKITVTITGTRKNLQAFKQFVDGVNDIKVEDTADDLAATVERETGNAKFAKFVAEQLQYVAGQYKCSATVVVHIVEEG